MTRVLISTLLLVFGMSASAATLVGEIHENVEGYKEFMQMKKKYPKYWAKWEGNGVVSAGLDVWIYEETGACGDPNRKWRYEKVDKFMCMEILEDQPVCFDSSNEYPGEGATCP